MGELESREYTTSPTVRQFNRNLLGFYQGGWVWCKGNGRKRIPATNGLALSWDVRTVFFDRTLSANLGRFRKILVQASMTK